MAEAKESLASTASFETMLKDIDLSSSELNVATDLMRTRVNVLCGRVERKFDTKKDPQAKINLVNKMKEEGWQFITPAENSVVGVGALVARLKKAGIEYTMKISLESGGSDDGEYESTTSLRFGKLNDEWQFYVTTQSWYRGMENSSTVEKIDHVGREYLPTIISLLPIFLKEYAEYLKSENLKVREDCKRADEISTKLIRSLES